MERKLWLKGESDLEKGTVENDDCCADAPQLPELSPSEQSSSSSRHILSGEISFRPFEESDRDHVQGLHEAWFPVSYKDEFFDELVKQRMVNSGERLFTCAAVYRPDEEQKQGLCNTGRPLYKERILEVKQTPLVDGASAYDSTDHRVRVHGMEGQIVSCIVGTFLDHTKIGRQTTTSLIADPERHKRVFYIMTLGTVNEFRHCRLGSTLVHKCIQLVERDPQCGALYLHVITFNEAAIRFYEKLGFCRVKEIKDYYRIDGEKYSCFLYAKYFHGNRGAWDVYYHFSRVAVTMWERLTAPFSMVLSKQRTR